MCTISEGINSIAHGTIAKIFKNIDVSQFKEYESLLKPFRHMALNIHWQPEFEHGILKCPYMANEGNEVIFEVYPDKGYDLAFVYIDQKLPESLKDKIRMPYGMISSVVGCTVDRSSMPRKVKFIMPARDIDIRVECRLYDDPIFDRMERD